MEANHNPDNYLAWAIITTVLCCLPFGIVAIIKSSRVDTLWAQGQYDEAVKSANDARKWCIISAVSCAIIAIIYTILIIAVGTFSLFTEFNYFN